ncbi:hypothetical protein [Clostridium sp. YIM B02555]|uniref:hypothetical protein n=1 Tax=Clostridium sp. YIM B02555 TaxID=2911968 RepID=UPI001EEF6398|nr:hypothetical protein [Clostridium sp. YIM B02555]
MRYGIKNKLISSNIGINECYEPNVPNKSTPKPYAVIVENDDTKNGNVVGFKRNIEIWLYDERLSFKSLDEMVKKTIDALNLQTIEDTKANETFTCIFNGVIENDIVDEEWDAIAKGISFTIVALHDETEANTDEWLEALSNYTKNIIDYPIYLNNWKKDFSVPSILWRVKSTSNVRELNSVIKETKVIVGHIVHSDMNQINKVLDDIEQNLIQDLKIPFNIQQRRYLTINNITENREADMLTQGQLTIEFFKRRMYYKPVETINHIKGKGTLK